MPDAPGTLRIRLEGPLVDDHRLPLVELERIVHQLRTALRDIGAVLSDYTPSAHGGRSRGFIEQAANLWVVAGARAGSFELDLELPAPAPLQPEELPTDAVPSLADHAVVALLEGLGELDEKTARLPDGYDRAVLRALSNIKPTISRGVTSIALTASWNGRPPLEAHLDAERVNTVTRLINEPVTAHAVVEGALRMVDHRALECRIDRPPRPSVTCLFDEADRERVHEAAGPDAVRLVRVVGEGEFPPGEREPRRMHVSSLAIISQQLPFDAQLFWRRPTLETLAEEQEIGELEATGAEADTWRDDDEAAALIAAIRQL